MIDKTIKTATTESRSIEQNPADESVPPAAPGVEAGKLPPHFASTESPARFVTTAPEP